MSKVASPVTTPPSCCAISATVNFGGLDASFIDDVVLLVEQYDARLPAFGDRLFDDGIAHNCEPIADFAQMRSGAIQDDRSGTALAGDDIGFKPVAVREVTAKDALV